jgi:hypothetical protein
MARLPKASKVLVKAFARDLLGDYGEMARTSEFFMDLFADGDLEITDPKTDKYYRVEYYDLEDAIEAL